MWLMFKLMMLLALANAAPLMAKYFLGNRWSRPLDANVCFLDGQPLFGTSKTIRGIVAALLLTGLGSAFLGLGLAIGFLFATCAMVGDLFSSFVKRRLNLSASSRATGLDQVPESLLPLLAIRALLPISYFEIVVLVFLFFISEIVLSKVMYKYHLRDRPY